MFIPIELVALVILVVGSIARVPDYGMSYAPADRGVRSGTARSINVLVDGMA